MSASIHLFFSASSSQLYHSLFLCKNGLVVDKENSWSSHTRALAPSRRVSRDETARADDGTAARLGMSRAVSIALAQRARDVVRCPFPIGGRTFSHASSSSSSSSSTTREYVLPGGVETLSILRSATTNGEIYLVGTAHVSKESAKQVAELVALVKPTSVCVELCDERYRTIREKIERGAGKGSSTGTSDFVRDAVKDFVGAFAPGGSSSLGDNLLGAAMKTFYGFFKLSGLDPGGEFKEAVKAADAMGAKIVCVDRDVRQTLRRVREAMSWEDVLTLMSGNVKPGGPEPPPTDGGMHDIERAIESLKTRAHIRQMREFLAHQVPKVSRVFVDERDEIMVQALLSHGDERVVAVVGMAHMDGIERRWEEAQKRLRVARQ